MLLKKLCQISKPFSTSSASLAWRSRIRQDQLVTHISSLLLQRRNWAPLLQSLDLSSKLTPSIFYQILSITQTDPHLSLNFFNWAKTRLGGFEHDLKSQCLIICLLLKNSQTVKPMLDSLVKHHSVSLLVDSMVRASKASNFDVSIALSILLQSYMYNGLIKESMEAFSLIRMHGIVSSVSAYNALLDALLRKNEIEWGWCFVGAMIRSGVWPDKSIWNLIATMLSKEGKFDRVRYMLKLGVETCVIYNLLIDSYSRKRDFSSALDLLGEMCSRNVDAGFGTYSSILDGACRYKENVVAEKIMEQMLEKRLLSPSSWALDDNLMIQKLCELGRSYAAEMLLSRGVEKGIELETATYGSMLRAFSKDGRVKEGIDMYRMICERNIIVKEKWYAAFLSALCRGEACREVSNIMRDVIERGVVPESDSDLSNYLGLLCKRQRWLEAEDVLNVIVDKRLAIDFSCCGLLIKRYCSTSCCILGEINKAIELHNKIELLEGSLDVVACNQLLEGLMRERKVVEADKIFDYYMRRGGLSSRSFVIMIGGLCGLNQLRKAMVYHDEMLQRGLKPDTPTYKRLITGFT